MQIVIGIIVITSINDIISILIFIDIISTNDNNSYDDNTNEYHKSIAIKKVTFVIIYPFSYHHKSFIFFLLM